MHDHSDFSVVVRNRGEATRAGKKALNLFLSEFHD
jgi:hypothetical protein